MNELPSEVARNNCMLAEALEKKLKEEAKKNNQAVLQYGRN